MANNPDSSPADSEDLTYLIAGLGNPGRQYKTNRHNVGFMLMDTLAARLGVAFTRMELKALVTRADQDGVRLILAKPQTYMNLSGGAVGSLASFYKISLDRLLIVYDDVDLPLGTLRLRSSGGSAGHKGMTSIIERLGTQEIPRLRIGIGRPPSARAAADYVLKDFSKSELELMKPILERAADAALTFVTSGPVPAMNQFNTTAGE